MPQGSIRVTCREESCATHPGRPNAIAAKLRRGYTCRGRSGRSPLCTRRFSAGPATGPATASAACWAAPLTLLILASPVSQRHAASWHPKQRRVWRVHALHAAARTPRRGVLFRRAADPLPVQRATLSCSRALVAEHRDSAAHYQGCDGRVFESPQNDKCEGCVGAHPFMRRPDAHASRACTFGQPNGTGAKLRGHGRAAARTAARRMPHLKSTDLQPA